MEVSELMVRNYVSLHDKVIQITCVDETYDTVNYFDSEAEGELTVSVKDIEPIQITEEYLKNNGFENVFRGRYRYEDGNSSVVEISTVKGDVKWVRISRYDEDYEDTKANCSYYDIQYFHELQNAMKICKINKDIEL